ncbi:NADP-dependent oxidoreductase [Actinomadura kijaniata]|uniref:NADPH:quinone reductase-like Zn-dependent oxidoreductase n=1 Tax=Actinomadura namibiensis TaxID=182080 RepID=A0A7W3M0L3_ACTNM|nr:NADP-dependent oxidoreductase [Actinomadura namibiensis]MBA8957600.1 NADPH:quinone reductase-like Zn-dependent oxidoreductase [Actinomadura namibiensis]
MRAVTVSEYGATPLVSEVPVPEPGPGEIQVRLIAAGMNPLDALIADGFLKDGVEARFPLVLGVDGAGVVTGAGEGVTRFGVGEQVYGVFFGVPRGLGTYAEYTVAEADGPVALMPRGIVYSQAAALPTAATAAHGLVEEARLGIGGAVLVVGATGGVGQMAVQFARDRGAKVIATARSDMADEMRYLGADATVDHSAGDLNRQVLAVHPGGVDAVLDLVSDRTAAEEIAQALKPGGVYLSTVHSLSPDAMEARGLRGVNFEYRPSAALLERIAELVDDGKLVVRVTDQVSLEDAPEALARLTHGGARGKTVVRP